MDKECSSRKPPPPGSSDSPSDIIFKEKNLCRDENIMPSSTTQFLKSAPIVMCVTICALFFALLFTFVSFTSSQIFQPYRAIPIVPTSLNLPPNDELQPSTLRAQILSLNNQVKKLAKLETQLNTITEKKRSLLGQIAVNPEAEQQQPNLLSKAARTAPVVVGASEHPLTLHRSAYGSPPSTITLRQAQLGRDETHRDVVGNGDRSNGNRHHAELRNPEVGRTLHDDWSWEERRHVPPPVTGPSQGRFFSDWLDRHHPAAAAQRREQERERREEAKKEEAGSGGDDRRYDGSGGGQRGRLRRREDRQRRRRRGEGGRRNDDKESSARGRRHGGGDEDRDGAAALAHGDTPQFRWALQQLKTMGLWRSHGAGRGSPHSARRAAAAARSRRRWLRRARERRRGDDTGGDSGGDR